MECDTEVVLQALWGRGRSLALQQWGGKEKEEKVVMVKAAFAKDDSTGDCW